MALLISSTHHLLGTVERRQVAEALGDSPGTAIPVHLLRKGGGQVHLAGELPNFDAVVIEDYSVGPELMAFGRDILSLGTILRGLDDWDAVNVPYEIALPLAAQLRGEMELRTHSVDDVYHLPDGQVAVVPNADVRMLTYADIPLLEAAPDDIRDTFDDELEAVIGEELIAGAVLPDAGVVAIAATYGFREKYVDLAVSTLAPYRCRGYASAAASLVACETQKAGRVPVWSCAPTNIGSLQVAYRLGFREVSRRVNIVLDS
jgi:hypothetical protein